MAFPRKLKVVELYAGTGRSIEPFRSWRSAELSLLVDNNEHAACVYRHNFPKARYSIKDLSSFTADNLETAAGGRVDVLLGCPPCQGYSDTGLRKQNDPRNVHITRFVEYVRHLKPLAIAMENVPLAADSVRFRALTSELERNGYEWTATIGNAALWGSCQSRQRLILVAIKKGVGSRPVFPAATHGEGSYFSYSKLKLCEIKEDPVGMLGLTPATGRVAKLLPECRVNEVGPNKIPTLEQIIGDLPAVGSAAGKKVGHFSWSHTPKILERMDKVPEGQRWVGGADHFSQTYGRLHRKGLVRTITTFFPNPGSGRFWHPTENRALSLREAARIQGFPDSFNFTGGYPSWNCLLIGNALDRALADVTYTVIRNSLES